MRPVPAASCLLIVLLAAAAVGAAQAAATAGDHAPRVGFYVFITSQGDVESSLAPGELRATIERELRGALESAGAVVSGGAELEEAVRRHRVRTSMLASVEFVAELDTTPGLDVLDLVDLVILPNNLMLALRQVDVPSGMLTDIRISRLNLLNEDLAETAADPVARWHHCLAQLSREVGSVSPTPVRPTARTLAVLPFQTFGTDAVVSLAVSTMLLRTILADSVYALPDPALVVTTLQQAGLEDHMLSAPGRTLIGQLFPCTRIVHPVLQSYAPRSRPSRVDIPDFVDSVHENVLLGSGVLALWAVDLRNGDLDGGAELFFEVRRETGWFGIPDRRSPLVQLEAAVGDLWRTFLTRLEDS